jgi:hypothetical protein
LNVTFNDLLLGSAQANVAASFAAFHHRFRRRTSVGLGQRHPVQGVELPVARAAQSMSGLVRRPDRLGAVRLWRA